jgi:hypothetical protein
VKGNSNEENLGDEEEAMHGQERGEDAIQARVGVDHSEVRRKRVDKVVELVVELDDVSVMGGGGKLLEVMLFRQQPTGHEREA